LFQDKVKMSLEHKKGTHNILKLELKLQKEEEEKKSKHRSFLF